jgi:hypothetical protein
MWQQQKTDHVNTDLMFLVDWSVFLKSIVTPIGSIVTDNRLGVIGGMGNSKSVKALNKY